MSPCFCFSVAVLWASFIGFLWEKAGLRDGGRRSCFGNIGSGGVCRHGLFLRCHSLRSHFGPSSPTPFFLEGLPDPTFHLRGCFLSGLYRPLRSPPTRELLRSPYFFLSMYLSYFAPLLHSFCLRTSSPSSVNKSQVRSREAFCLLGVFGIRMDHIVSFKFLNVQTF